jgi:hypothetical protein
MGLSEQIQAGANLERADVTFTTSVTGVGSASIAPSYAILKIQASSPCRLRLYDNLSSRDEAGEIVRPFGDTNISESVALVGDFSMSAAGQYAVDPVLYAVSADFNNPYTYYRVSPASSIDIKVTMYPIEIVAPGVGAYSLDNRRTLPVITASLSAGATVSGSLASTEIPQTYLLVSASANSLSRLRLYSTTAALSNTQEITRPFSVEPSASFNLIADMILSASKTTYFSPKIIGANLANMGSNLLLIRGNQALIDGENELYYIIENISASPIQVSASLHVYSLED